MALESASTIDGLNASNPVSTDPISAADDHIRLLKSTVKATFPSISGAVNATHTEINTVADGNTSATATTLASTDALVVNDAGVMKQVALSDLLTYLNASLTSANAVTTATSLATINSTGNAVTISGLTYPSADGSANQQLKTDGSGNLSFVTPASQLTAGNAIQINSGQIDHQDTSSQASVDNSGFNVIQDVTLDTYGHVTGITSADLTPPLDEDSIGSVIFAQFIPQTNITYSGFYTFDPVGPSTLGPKLRYAFFDSNGTVGVVNTDLVSGDNYITSGTWKSLANNHNLNSGIQYGLFVRIS